MATRARFATVVVTALAGAGLAPAAHAQNLAGSQVTVAGYCCTTPPAPATQVTNALTATVGPATEFPAGSLTSLTSSLAPLPVAIDVGSNYIEINYSAAGVAAPGGFNGFVFTFANAPAISAVTLDPASTYSPAVSYAGNQVYVNEAGLALSPTSMAMIDVTTTAPVPEPETVAMLLSGLALLGWTARRRRRQGPG